MPAVCKLFGQLARREVLWKNVCRIRGWGEDVEGAPAELIPTLDPRPQMPLLSLQCGGRAWWQATRRWSAAMVRTKALYDELVEQPGATEWEQLDDAEVSELFAQLLGESDQSLSASLLQLSRCV